MLAPVSVLSIHLSTSVKTDLLTQAMIEQTNEGFLGTLKRLRDTLFTSFENRLQIVELELREEKDRALALFISAVVLILAGLMTLIAITFLAVVAFWEQAVWVLVGFGLVYGATGLTAILVIRNKLKTPPFAETINQIKKDRIWLFSRK